MLWGREEGDIRCCGEERRGTLGVVGRRGRGHWVLWRGEERGIRCCGEERRGTLGVVGSLTKSTSNM